jgi:hypothetical protein
MLIKKGKFQAKDDYSWLVVACLTLFFAGMSLTMVFGAIGLVLAVIGLVVPFYIWKVSRREKRVCAVVEKYVSSYRALPKEKSNNIMPQLLFDAGALDTRNNSELKTVRKRIYNQNLPDPCALSKFLQETNLHKFFRFVRQHNLRLDGAGQLMAAIGRYQGLFVN